MRFCCGVTIYYPSNEELNNISSYIEQFDHIYVYDNTEGIEANKNRKYFSNIGKVSYMANGSNDGLSKAYNIMCNTAIRDDFNYICIFDQDTQMNNNDIVKIIEAITLNNDIDVGIYAPNVIYNYNNKVPKDNYMESLTSIAWCISSGSFINLRIFSEINGFDESYFIDRVDYDYCYKIKKKGGKIYRVNESVLYQSLGEKKRVFFVNIFQHSPNRHYYIFRNRLYFYKNKLNKNFIDIFGRSLSHILKVILFEDRKIEKLHMFFIAWKDFKHGNMGKYKG